MGAGLSTATIWTIFLTLAVSPLLSGEPGILTTVAGGGPLTIPLNGSTASRSALFQLSAVAVSPSGAVYFALGGRVAGPQVVAEILSNGQIEVVAGGQTVGFSGDGGPAKQGSLNAPGSLAFDEAGNLFIADTGNQRVRRVAVDGTITTYAGNGQTGYAGDGGQATSAALNSPVAVAADRAGNLFIADSHNHCVRKVNAEGVITTVAGTGVPGYSGDGGPASSAQLNNPLGVAVNSVGDIFIADADNYLIRKISGGIITTVSSVYPLPGPPGPEIGGVAVAYYPNGLAFDSADNLYIAATLFETRILKLSATGQLTEVAGMPTSTGYNVDNTPFCCDGVAGPESIIAPNFVFAPVNLAVDATGNVYIADSGFNRVRVLSPGGILSTVAGDSGFIFDSESTTADSAYILANFLAADESGNVFFSDRDAIRKVTSAGVLTTVAGNGVAGFEGDGGLATQALLNNDIGLGGLAADGTGNLYIADTGNNRVRRVGANGIITTFAGNGQAGSSGDGGQAVAAELNGPLNVAVDLQSDVYILDQSGSTIRKVGSNGVIQTVATGQYWTAIAVDPSNNLFAVTSEEVVVKIAADGSAQPVAGGGQESASGMGIPALSAGFGNVRGICFDASGTLYISDAKANLVYFVESDGILHILAGTGVAAFSGNGGPATAATLNSPWGVTAAGNGHVYIADAGNSRIREFEPLFRPHRRP